MVYRRISLDMKQRALELVDKGWEAEDIAYALGVSSKSIARWADNYDAYGQVHPPSALHGRPRILNANAADDLYRLIRETPSLFLDEIKEWLALYHDQPISTTVLHDNLRDLGLTS
jgi:transposase